MDQDLQCLLPVVLKTVFTQLYEDVGHIITINLFNAVLLIRLDKLKVLDF